MVISLQAQAAKKPKSEPKAEPADVADEEKEAANLTWGLLSLAAQTAGGMKTLKSLRVGDVMPSAMKEVVAVMDRGGLSFKRLCLVSTA
jgi:hypothetical protein